MNIREKVVIKQVLTQRIFQPGNGLSFQDIERVCHNLLHPNLRVTLTFRLDLRICYLLATA